MDNSLQGPHEGVLIKFTNVVKGWQARWFVLDPGNGTFQYYLCESDKYERARGSIQLAGAVISPSDEDSLIFSVSPAVGESYKLRAQDTRNRQMWINRLRVVAEMHTRAIAHHNPPLPPREQRVCEAAHSSNSSWAPPSVEGLAVMDAFTQVSETLEEGQRQNAAFSQVVEELPTRGGLLHALDSNVLMMKATSHSTLQCLEQCLQILRAQHISNCSTHYAKPSHTSHRNTFDSPKHSHSNNPFRHFLPDRQKFSSLTLGGSDSGREVRSSSARQSSRSFSSGHDSDASESARVSFTSGENKVVVSRSNSQKNPARENRIGGSADNVSISSQLKSTRVINREGDGSESSEVDGGLTASLAVPGTESDVSDSEDTSANGESHVGGEDGQRSVIMHIISQLKLGMDLTRVTLPTFILEKRSLLEMFADFLGHPDLFLRIPSNKTAETRLLAVVKWYMTSIHVGRQGSIAKKPYNPIIGEIFQCRWRVPGYVVDDDNRTDKDHYYMINFVAEQVSHHPPVSAFYIECPEKKMCINAHIWTKSKFMGMSIGVNLIGDITLSLGSIKENYHLSMPSAYARSVLTEPWVELGGRIEITCPETGFSAPITFYTKPFYGGRLHAIAADLKDNNGALLCKVTGHWDAKMEFLYADGYVEVIDVRSLAHPCRKRVRPVEKQFVNESRRLWYDVTKSLSAGDLERATNHKRYLEDGQRKAEAGRKALGMSFQTKLFHSPLQEHWVYKKIPQYAGVTCFTPTAVDS